MEILSKTHNNLIQIKTELKESKISTKDILYRAICNAVKISERQLTLPKNGLTDSPFEVERFIIKNGYKIGDIIEYVNINKKEVGKISRVYKGKYYVNVMIRGYTSKSEKSIRSVKDIIGKVNY